MIWDIIQQSSFSTHFSKPDLTLEQLLVDQNILTEMKNLNPQLLQYVNDNIDDIVTKLIEYVTVMPEPSQGQERCFKLPYVSSEMLAIESQIFYTIFFGKKGQTGLKNTKYLDMLFHFLKTEAVNNELLLGYFEKVVTNLQKGRKIDLTVYISKNLHLFTQCLHLETMGNLLKSCIILQNQKQGLLYEERKDISSELVHGFISPSNQIRQAQIRSVCLNALVDVLAKHKTFSSGDQIVGYLFGGCGEMLVMYGMLEVEQVTNFMAGIMAKSLQKIYNPELDIKQNIFKLPSTHKKLLIGYLTLRLHMIKFPKNQPSAPSPPIRQQNGQYVTKFPGQTLDYLTLLALTLQNEIDQFLLGLSKNSNENNETFNQYFDFIWKCMKQHPKNDIALVQIVRIFLYVCAEGSDKSANQKQLRNKLVVEWNIVQKINQIFVDQGLEKLLRPHLFQIWNKLRVWISQYVKDESNEWKNICTKYEKLIPLHSKASGLNYTRPTNIKLVIDEQDVNQQNPNTPQAPTLDNQQKNQDQPTNWRSPQTKQEQAEMEQTIQKQENKQEEQGKNENAVVTDTDKKYEITKQMQAWMENGHTSKKDSDINQQFGFEGENTNKNENKNKGQFQQFDQFFTSEHAKQQSKDNKKGDKFNQFSAFDAFI